MPPPMVTLTMPAARPSVPTALTRPEFTAVAGREGVIGPSSCYRFGFSDTFAELSFPPCDDGGRQAVANDVGHRSRHVHQFVHPENQGDAFERQPVARQRTGEDNE